MTNIAKKNSERGFSMVELLVSIFVFSIIVLVTGTIFVKSLDIERRSFSAQIIQENALAVFELMGKEIRVADISTPDNNCTSSTLDMTVYDESGSPVDVTYALSAGAITRVYGGSTFQLTTSDVVFDRLLFCVNNSGLDDMPTRVTIIASISNSIGKPVRVDMQTTISSREITQELQN